MASWQLLSFTGCRRSLNLVVARAQLAQGTQISPCWQNKPAKAVITEPSRSLVSLLTFLHPTKDLEKHDQLPLWMAMSCSLARVLQGVWHRLSGSWQMQPLGFCCKLGFVPRPARSRGRSLRTTYNPSTLIHLEHFWKALKIVQHVHFQKKVVKPSKTLVPT